MSHLVEMMGQVKKLKSGVGVQSLLDEARRILGNPIVMFNTEYKLLAFTEAVTDDPIWNEIIANGSFSQETQRIFENEGFIEEIANASRTVLLKSGNLKYDRIEGKLFNKNKSYVSNLMIVACNKAFDENDAMVFDAICKLVSREISKNESYQEYEQTHQEGLIKSLIDGDYDTKLDMAQVGSIYDSLESNLYVVVADLSQCTPEHTDIAFFRDMFRQAEPAYKYAIYSDYIVIIVSTNADTLNVNKELVELIKIFEQYSIYAGISSRFENLFELQKHYMEALKAMRFTSECRSSQHIFPCDTSSIEKMEQISALENGKGIQYFMDKGPGILGNPLLFHDLELNLLGYSKNVEIIDPIWEELITYGTSSDETIKLFGTEGYINTMESTKGGAILTSEKIKYDRISWRVYSNEKIMIGCLSIVNTDTPFTEDELVLFGAFTQKFSKEVEKIEFYNDYGRVYSETVINRLISGKIDDYTFYTEDIGNLYDNLMENLYLVVVDTAQCESEQINLTYFRELFNWPGTVNRYAIYGSYIIIIISIDSPPLCEKNEYKEIGKFFEKENIYAGISSCFDNIYELPKYYLEAVSALNVRNDAMESNSGQRIFLYDEITNASDHV